MAINKDGEAPIYSIADYGLEADLFEALPQFLEELKRKDLIQWQQQIYKICRKNLQMEEFLTLKT